MVRKSGPYGRRSDESPTRTGPPPHPTALLQGEPGRPRRDRAVVAPRERDEGRHRPRRRPARPQEAPLRPEGEAGDLPPPDRLAAASRPVRLQARTRQERRQGL